MATGWTGSRALQPRQAARCPRDESVPKDRVNTRWRRGDGVKRARTKMTSSILALLGLILASASAELTSRIVRTKYGELSGVIVTLDRHLEGVEVFRGVPYASPPIGSLRFMPPVSGALWHGVKVANKFGPVCPQRLPELTDKMPKGRVEYLRRLLPYLRNQSEDCLYLNIYAPVQGRKFNRLFS